MLITNVWHLAFGTVDALASTTHFAHGGGEPTPKTTACSELHRQCSQLLPKQSDLQQLLCARGVPLPTLSEAMAAAHERVGCAAGGGRRPSVRVLLRCAGLAVHLVRCGWPVAGAMSVAWRQVRTHMPERRCIVLSCFLNTL